MSDIKQVICVRNDLKVRRGKLMSSACHASMAWLVDRLDNMVVSIEGHSYEFLAVLTQSEKEWLRGLNKKVVVQVNSEEHLLEIYHKAQQHNLEAHLITDVGLTEFTEPTRTAVGIGPDLAAKIDKVTGNLQLW